MPTAQTKATEKWQKKAGYMTKGFAFEGFYERKLLQTRYWDNKMYLYPIAQTEIDRGRGLVQNPGW